MREDFNLMLGDLQELLDGQVTDEETKTDDVTSTSCYSQERVADSESNLGIADLEIIGTLGIGAFGQVKLVKSRKSTIMKDKSFDGKNDKDDAHADPTNTDKIVKTYALKILSKKSIVENGLQDHVLMEKKIMEQLHHPFILNFYHALQDDTYIYFLLEVLLGGELFKFLRSEFVTNDLLQKGEFDLF
jgi:serine/threonine protein kinase